MKKSEMEEKLKNQQLIIDRQKKRVKDQNESAKERWDNVSCRLPKGTRKRITDKGLTVNGFINSVVLKELERLENL